MSDRPLRVAVDARSLNSGHLRGMGKSVYELIRRTATSGAIEWHLLSNRPDLPMQLPAEGIAFEVFETKGYRIHSWEQWSLPRRALQLGVDLLHAPSLTMPWWQPLPTIVTIHDAIPWQGQDSAWPPGFYRDRLLPAAYHRASAVLTISNTSRRDLLAKWPKLQDKLHVVPLGADERYFNVEPDQEPVRLGEYVASEPYLLYLGGFEPRKRLTWALQTWWGSSVPGLSLVVCGLERAAHETVRQMVPPEFKDRLILAPFIREEEMPRIYMRAAAVLYPTLYEGFGLPVVEAQAVGTPILFSDVGSLTELKGPGAVVLPTDDLAAWVRAVNEVVTAGATSNFRGRIARAWAEQYSWDSCVQRTLAIYRSVAAAAGNGSPERRPR